MVFKVTRNISEKNIVVAPTPFQYFPTSKDGFDTFVNLDAYNETKNLFRP